MATTAPLAGASTRPAHRDRAWHRAISPLVVLAAWQLAAATGALPADKLAGPTQIFSALGGMVLDGRLADAVGISVQRVVIGFLIGASAGLALAVVAGLARAGENAVDPPMQMLRTLPHFGLLPLFVLWFGVDETPKLLLIALGVAFPLYVNTVGGIRGVDPKFLETARVLGLSGGQRLRQVVLPSALPSTLIGLRLSLGVAWLSLIVAEQINTTRGIGYLVTDAASFGRTDEMVGCLLIYGLLGLATDSLVRLIERKALQWRHG